MFKSRHSFFELSLTLPLLLKLSLKLLSNLLLKEFSMMRIRSVHSPSMLPWLAVLAFTVRCGDDDRAGDFDSSDRGQLTVTSSLGAAPFRAITFPATPAGQTARATVTLANVDPKSPLHLSLAFQVTESSAAAIQLTGVRRGNQALTPTGPGRFDGLLVGPLGVDRLEVDVEYTNLDGGVPHDAVLLIESDTRRVDDRRFQITFSTSGGRPRLDLAPKVVDFGVVRKDDAASTKRRPLTLTNSGSAPLEIRSARFSGHPDMRLTLPTEAGGQTFAPSGEPVTFSPPLSLGPQQVMQLAASYLAQSPEPAEAILWLDSNDPSEAQEGTRVDLLANRTVPKLRVLPAKVAFGARKVGSTAQQMVELENIGTAPLVVTGLAFQAGSSTAFTLGYATLKRHEDGSPPSEDVPVTLQVNERSAFGVTFAPAQLGDVAASLQVTSNAYVATATIPVTGRGVDTECPVPVIVVQEGEEVIPQTILHLFGDQSVGLTSPISTWSWKLEAPAQSVTVLKPSTGAPNPTLEVNVAGVYRLTLEVWDQNGNKSCEPAVKEVAVVPEEGIHVELTWKTPADPDETDVGPDAGSDLDLHFIDEASATGTFDVDGDGALDPWFDPLYDAFWYHPKPSWGSFNPAIPDDPTLDRDDTDGGGPENLNLDEPEVGKRYRVAVHYWADHDYGPALATVRIYIHKVLVLEVKDVKLFPMCLWDVATIDWPSGKVTQVTDPKTGGLRIICPYINPYFKP